MYIPKQYLVVLALIGAVAFGFVSHVLTERLGPAHTQTGELSTTREQVAPGADAGPQVVAGTSFEQAAASSGPPAAPIVTQPGAAGSTTNIYLTIVNSPAGTTTVPPSVKVVPGP